MRKALIVAALVLLTTFAYSAPSPAVTKARKTVHTITFEAGKCSATAVAPHMILTATHCTHPAEALTVDGKDYIIVLIFSDSNDHSLVLIANGDVGFTDIAGIATPQAQPEPGDAVFMWGAENSSGIMFRAGYVAGPRTDGKRHGTLYQLDSFFGDSGAAIFNSDGQIIGLLYGIEDDVEQHVGETVPTYIKYTVSYQMRFPPSVLSSLQQFGSTPVKK